MPEKYTYLLVDFFCIAIPFIFSFHPKINFHRQWKFFAIPCLLVAIVFYAWDITFTHMGIWSFNARYVVGLYLLGMPVEEYLFFIFIPYSSVFTYYCFSKFFNFEKFRTIARTFTLVLILFLAIAGFLNLHRLYTSVTFLLLAGVLASLLLGKARFMVAFYTSFIVLLIPFFISNGILTGGVTAQPVVCYNNDHILGIRMMTIPFEDIFYGMLLILCNVAGFEYLRNLKRSI